MARFGSFGSGMAQGYLEQSALTQKRDAADATAKYRAATLDASALTQRIELTKSALAENAELITRAQDYARQNQNDPNIVQNTKTAIDGLVQQRKVMYAQLKQMGGLPDAGADPRAAALGSTPTAEDTFAVGRSIMGKTSGKKLGEAPLDTDAAWEVKETANGDWVRINPLTGDDEPILEVEQGTNIPDSKLVMDVKGPGGTVAKWIHSSIMPEGFDPKTLPGDLKDSTSPAAIYAKTGWVVAAEGGPNTSIAPAWLLHPNPATGQARIVPYNKNTMPDEEYQAHLKAGYLPVGTPGWGTADTSGVTAATSFGGSKSQVGKAQESYTQNVVASAMTKQLFGQLHKAGPGVLGVPGFLREHVGGALGGMFAPIGLDGEEGFNDLINFFTGGELTSDEVNNIRTKFKQMITPAVKAYTGEESGRITKEEREIGYKTLAATKAMRSITQARQALLGMLTLQESEQMRIRAMLGQEQLHDLTNFEQYSDFANKLYNDLGGEPGSENDRVIMAAVTQMMDNLQIVQKAIIAGVADGGVLTDRKWAQSKAAN
jgi:hypothetical protein